MSHDLRSAVRLIDASWPGALSPDRIAAYAEGLADVPVPYLLDAVRYAVRVEEHRPTVATLRRIVLHRAGLLGPPPSEAVAAAHQLDEWAAAAAVAPGAGPIIERPDVHPLVLCAWEAAGPDAPPGVFTARYRDEQQRVAADLAAHPLNTGALNQGSRPALGQLSDLTDSA